jgi:hypothetical protein
VFKSALDAALPVYAIGTALIFVFGSLLKTDERRSSVTLWGRSAQSQTPQKSYLPGKSRWRRTPFASVPIGTVCPDGKLKRPSCLIGYHGSFWAGSGMSAYNHLTRQAALIVRPHQDRATQPCGRLIIRVPSDSSGTAISFTVASG